MGSFTIFDLDEVCSITDSIKININDTTSGKELALNVDYGSNTITQKPIKLSNFGNITDATVYPGKLGTPTISFAGDQIELKYVAKSSLALFDTVEVEFKDVCEAKIKVKLVLALTNTRPTEVNPSRVVEFIINNDNDINLPIAVIALDRNKNQNQMLDPYRHCRGRRHH